MYRYEAFFIALFSLCFAQRILFALRTHGYAIIENVRNTTKITIIQLAELFRQKKNNKVLLQG